MQDRRSVAADLIDLAGFQWGQSARDPDELVGLCWRQLTGTEKIWLVGSHRARLPKKQMACGAIGTHHNFFCGLHSDTP